MIIGGGHRKLDKLSVSADVFIYGLGFEERSTAIVNSTSKLTKIFAIRMPVERLHSYERNVQWAKDRQHRIVDNFSNFLEHELPQQFSNATTPLRVVFDISSVNRYIMASIMLNIVRWCRAIDEIFIYYCPAAFNEPDWSFPRIESLGPVRGEFSAYNADPNKPLCLVLGLGFEPGVAMGIISQLEPKLSYCFWGSGVDGRFDKAVRHANFDFDFVGFNVSLRQRPPCGMTVRL